MHFSTEKGIEVKNGSIISTSYRVKTQNKKQHIIVKSIQYS